jgi:hypothetical protein
MYRALIKLTPSPCYLLTLYHHAPLIFNSLQYSALYSQIDGLFQYFSFSIFVAIFFTVLGMELSLTHARQHSTTELHP